jgi:hypothetical protein
METAENGSRSKAYFQALPCWDSEMFKSCLLPNLWCEANHIQLRSQSQQNPAGVAKPRTAIKNAKANAR